MPTRSFSARELHQRSSAVTQAVDQGFDVIITKRGRPTYRIVRVTDDAADRSLGEVIAELPDTSSITLELERLEGQPREVEL